MTSRKKWDNEEQIFDVYKTLAMIRKGERYENTKEWQDDCSKVAAMLSMKYNEVITPTMIEGITIFPSAHSKSKFSPSVTKRFGIAINAGFITTEELNEYYMVHDYKPRKGKETING
jgi:hypothetical protein